MNDECKISILEKQIENIKNDYEKKIEDINEKLDNILNTHQINKSYKYNNEFQPLIYFIVHIIILLVSIGIIKLCKYPDYTIWMIVILFILEVIFIRKNTK